VRYSCGCEHNRAQRSLPPREMARVTRSTLQRKKLNLTGGTLPEVLRTVRNSAGVGCRSSAINSADMDAVKLERDSIRSRAQY